MHTDSQSVSWNSKFILISLLNRITLSPFLNYTQYTHYTTYFYLLTHYHAKTENWRSENEEEKIHIFLLEKIIIIIWCDHRLFLNYFFWNIHFPFFRRTSYIQIVRFYFCFSFPSSFSSPHEIHTHWLALEPRKMLIDIINSS